MVLHVDVRAGLNDSHVEKIHAFIVQNQDEKIAQAPLEALIKPYTVARIADQYWHLLQKRAD
jgi:predicted nucleotide-binding protein